MLWHEPSPRRRSSSHEPVQVPTETCDDRAVSSTTPAAGAGRGLPRYRQARIQMGDTVRSLTQVDNDGLYPRKDIGETLVLSGRYRLRPRKLELPGRNLLHRRIFGPRGRRHHARRRDGADPRRGRRRRQRSRAIADLRRARCRWNQEVWRAPAARRRGCARPWNEIRSNAAASDVRPGPAGRTARSGPWPGSRSAGLPETIASRMATSPRTIWASLSPQKMSTGCRRRQNWSSSQARPGWRSPAPCWRRYGASPAAGACAAELDDIAIAVVPFVQQREIVDDVVDGRNMSRQTRRSIGVSGLCWCRLGTSRSNGWSRIASRDRALADPRHPGQASVIPRSRMAPGRRRRLASAHAGSPALFCFRQPPFPGVGRRVAMSGLQQRPRSSGRLLSRSESMRISAACRAGTVVAKPVPQGERLLASRPRGGKQSPQPRRATVTIEIKRRGSRTTIKRQRVQGEQNGGTTTNRVLRQGWHRQVDHLAEHAGGAGRDGPQDPDRRLRSQGGLDPPDPARQGAGHHPEPGRRGRQRRGPRDSKRS